VNLYRSVEFTVESSHADYHGPGEHRLIMALKLT
jgi:hypothetical protein